jgi:hypothetical protein
MVYLYYDSALQGVRFEVVYKGVLGLGKVGCLGLFQRDC